MEKKKDIVVIKQEKVCLLIILVRRHYIEKYLNILELGQLNKLGKYSTKTVENKM